MYFYITLSYSRRLTGNYAQRTDWNSLNSQDIQLTWASINSKRDIFQKYNGMSGKTHLYLRKIESSNI